MNSERDVVMRPELQRALEDLEKKILDRLGQEREDKERRDVWRTVGETLQEEGAGAVSITVCVCVFTSLLMYMHCVPLYTRVYCICMHI